MPEEYEEDNIHDAILTLSGNDDIITTVWNIANMTGIFKRMPIPVN